MHRTLRTFSLAFTAALGLVATSASAATVEEIVAKNLEARGGKDKLEAVKTARMTGTMSMGGMEMPISWEWKAPNLLRIEFTMQGMTGVQAYDGANGWMHMPFLGKAEPEKMPAEQAKDMSDDADFAGPLATYKEKGYTLEYLGEGDADGTPSYKLKLTKKDGDTIVYYLEKDSYLEIKQDVKSTVQGQEMMESVDLADYKEVNGLLLPHSMDFNNPAGGKRTLTFKTVELNPDIPADRFVMPAPKPAAAPAPPKP